MLGKRWFESFICLKFHGAVLHLSDMFFYVHYKAPQQREALLLYCLRNYPVAVKEQYSFLYCLNTFPEAKVQFLKTQNAKLKNINHFVKTAQNLFQNGLIFWLHTPLSSAQYNRWTQCGEIFCQGVSSTPNGLGLC